MITVTDEEFSRLIDEAIQELPQEHMRAVQNVAILYEEDPTAEQREQLQLLDGETLFGLYEGVPLAHRQGVTSYPPDKITIFKGPITAYCQTRAQLKAEIKHTVWHEIAHYFGLDHDAIHRLERAIPPARKADKR